ncbi:MAG TPA: hypothetical protein VGK41_01105 [Solirubrobacterales bacterium]
MLWKPHERIFVPGTPGVPYSPARTVCQATPAPGDWVQVCDRIDIPDGGGFVILYPPGAELVVVESETETDPLTGEPLVIDMYFQVCRASFIPSGPPGPVVCTHYPEVPEVPAVPSRTDVVSSLAWNAGAVSGIQHSGDCEAVFPMSPVIGVAVGLTDDLADVGNPDRLTHGLYFHRAGSGAQPVFNAIESGRIRTSAIQYADGDEFRIRRANGVVTYWHEGTCVYTSQVNSTGAVNVGTCLYGSGDSIVGGPP